MYDNTAIVDHILVHDRPVECLVSEFRTEEYDSHSDIAQNPHSFIRGQDLCQNFPRMQDRVP